VGGILGEEDQPEWQCHPSSTLCQSMKSSPQFWDITKTLSDFHFEAEFKTKDRFPGKPGTPNRRKKPWSPAMVKKSGQCGDWRSQGWRSASVVFPK
jgi:hypothetical protein